MSLASEFLDQLFSVQAETKPQEITEAKPQEITDKPQTNDVLKTDSNQNEKELSENNVEKIIKHTIPFQHGNKVTILNGEHKSKTGKVKAQILSNTYTIETDLEEKFPPSLFGNARLGDTIKIKNYYGKITNIQAPTFTILVDVKELDKPLEINEAAHNVIRFLFFKDKAIEQNKQNFINIFKNYLQERIDNAKSEDEKNAYSFALKYLTAKMYPRSNPNHVNVLLQERQKLEFELQKESSIRAAIYQDHITENDKHFFEATILDAPYNEVKTEDQIMSFVAYRMKNFGMFRNLKQIKLEPDQIISEKYIISTEESPYFTFFGTLGNFTPLLYITQSIVHVTIQEELLKLKEDNMVEILEGELKGKSGKIVKKHLPHSSLELDNGEIITIENNDLFYHDLKTNDGIVQVEKIFDNGDIEVQLFGEQSQTKTIKENDILHYFTGFNITKEIINVDESYELVHETLQEDEEEDFFAQENMNEIIESDQLDHPEMTFSYKDKDRMFRMDEILTATQKTHKENLQKIMNVIGINDSYINLHQTIKDCDEIQTIIKNKLEVLKLDRLFRQTDMKLIYIVLIYKQLLLNLQPIRNVIPDFSLSYMIHALFTKASGKITTKSGKSTYLSPNDINSSTIWLNYKWFKFSTPIKVLQDLYNSEKYEDMYQLLILNAVEFISDLLNIIINLNPVSKKLVVVEEQIQDSSPTNDDDSIFEDGTLEESRREAIRTKLIEVMKKTLSEKLSRSNSELNRKGIEFALDHLQHINYTIDNMVKNKEDYLDKFGEIQYNINLVNLKKINQVFERSFNKYNV